MRISATLICGNEKDNIAPCLASVAWCDEVVVVDSDSTDGTYEIAQRFTPHVYRQTWLGFAAQRQYAWDRCTGDWILVLDADERCTPELRAEIERLVADPGDAVAFRIRRHVFYLGRWINHGGWYPDYTTRLARRDRGRWVGDHIHERLEVDGKTRDLKGGELTHYTFRNFSAQIRALDRYTDLAAAEMKSRGRNAYLIAIVFRPIGKFLESYIWKRGFLDGRPGFIISVVASFYVFTRLVKLWESRALPGTYPPDATPPPDA